MHLNHFDTIIKDGTVVSGTGTFRADVAIKNGRITKLAEGIEGEAPNIIDARGRLVLPGGVDEHVHPVYLDDIRTSSLGAIFGGTTTLVFFAYAHQGSRLMDAITEMRHEGSESSFTDFGLHIGIFDAAEQVNEIEEVASQGVRSFKMFMTYAAKGWATDDYQMIRAMSAIADVGGMAMVHAENGLAIEFLESKASDARPDGQDSADAWLATRPSALEAEAVYRACALAEVAGCDLFIPHVTSRRALGVVAERRQAGQPVVAETCPHYLTLTRDAVRSRGALAKVGPPLRTAADVEALWDGLRSGVLQAIGSDHAPKKTPENAADDVLSADFGAPAVETRMSITYDAAVNAGRLGVQRLVQVLCENPARIFGLYPRKGAILPGADADIVLWDPLKKHKIDGATMQSRGRYSLHDGVQCLGGPELVMQRGRVLVRHGELVGDSAGQFLLNAGGDVLLSESQRVMPDFPPS